MKRLQIYVDASVVGGCEDEEFSTDSRALWQLFVQGVYTMVISEHTVRELDPAPSAVQRRLEDVPNASKIILADNLEAEELTEIYLRHGVVGPGSRSDALHVALATINRVDLLVSWNFKHIVNFNRIRLFNGVNCEQGYSSIEIRTPKEVLLYGDEI